MTYDVPASKIVISAPITGTADMLEYQASTARLGGVHHKAIMQGSVVIEVIERTLDADTIRRQIDQVQKDVDLRAAWANNDLAAFKASAEKELRDSLALRKQRILHDRQTEAALAIPVQTSKTVQPAANCSTAQARPTSSSGMATGTRSSPSARSGTARKQWPTRSISS